ncbi:RNA polymerase [Flavobacterium sp. 9AF]|uniref:RNA polymerase sigma factor n=1 Tax=Flavobacterium sp. 9AF TaxID=2653142 RepID=UPI0012EFD111|nr:RNA polymerase sigma factor [Flavobacterium sp. 9AF]VXB12667.1 RNA polymerase [Flavobacterium sp. 9AF]
MSNTEDQNYIQKVVQGDTNSFAFLVNKYKDLVFTIAFRMLKNREEAEEVAQDIFVKVFKSLSKFQGNSKFSTWIYKIAYNSCLDVLKKYKKELISIPVDDYKGSKILELENIVNLLVKKEQEEMIQKCLNLLPYEESILLTLYYYEEQTLEEIAKVLNITSNNAKVKLFRSRKKLEAILRTQLPKEIIEHYEK